MLRKPIRSAKADQFAKGTAKILLETQAVLFRPEAPFVLTSGKKSPTYTDCRKLIGFVDQRHQLMQMGVELLQDAMGLDAFDVVAGGETAGIPYAGFLATMMHKNMAYIRKKPKGFGRGARIEGNLKDGDTVLLVEDMATDGGSKMSFVDGIRDAGGVCNHCFVVFFYDIFEGALENLQNQNLTLHYLATWYDILAYVKEHNYFTPAQIDGVEQFLQDPTTWQSQNL